VSLQAEENAGLTPEQRAVAELYRSFGPAIYRRCLRLLQSDAAAQDATQEIFLKLSVRLSRSIEQRSALAFIFAAATHHCLNVLRNDALRTGKPAELDLRQGSVQALYPERKLVQDILVRFDATTQAVAVGVLVDGMELDEVAGVLGISAKTVSRKLSRFVNNARKFLTRTES
jgi:RNA polymerase sigma-70 factor (ECF subfamily)